MVRPAQFRPAVIAQGGVLAGMPVIGFLLGSNFEICLRQMVLIYKADLTVLLTRPISLTFLGLTIIFMCHLGFRAPRKRARGRAGAGASDDDAT